MPEDNIAWRIIGWATENVIPWMLILLFAVLVIVLVWLAVDISVKAFSPKHKIPVAGQVKRKNHRPGWTQYMPMLIGKISTIQPIHHPEQWELIVQKDGTTGEEGERLILVDKETWSEISIGGRWERE